MTYIVLVLVFALKALAIALAALIALLLLLVCLPVKARVALSASASGLLDGILEDDAIVVARLPGSSPAPEDPESPVIALDLDFGVDAHLMGGAIGCFVAGGRRPEVSALGMRFRPGKRAKRTPEKAGPGRVVGKPKAAASKQPGAKKRGAATDGISLTRVRRYLSSEVREKTWNAAKSVIRALHLGGTLDAACGFPDPGTTGMVFAAWSALGGSSRFGGVTFRPIFSGEAFDVRCEGELHFVPVRIGYIAARYLMSREIRPLWRKPRKEASSGTEAMRSAGAATAH